MAEEGEGGRPAKRGEERAMERWGAESPWEMIHRMREDINRLFWQFGMPTPPAGAGKVMPAVDVWETDTEVKVRADVPGLDPKDLDVTVAGNTLTIKGQFRKEEEVREEGFYRAERNYGSFERAVDLPQPVRAEKARATYRQGVLEVTLPKQEEAKRKTQKVRIEATEQREQTRRKRGK